MAGGGLVAEPVAPMQLRGIAETQAVLRLRGADLSFSRFDEARSAQDGFLARDAERARLAEGFARAVAGDGHALLVLGEAGLGKSRLLREAARLAPGAMRVLSSQALRWRQEVELHPIARLIGAAPGAAAEAPALAALLGRETDDARWLALHPSERSAETLEATIRWLLALAQDRPTAVILDDLHWADAATVRVIQRLVPLLAGQPLLLVLVARPGHGLGALPDGVETLALEPMAAEAATALAIARGASPAQAGEIARRSGGNPFFIEQAAALGDALPPQARALLIERVDRLPAGAREVLLTLAAFEQPVEPDLLYATTAPEMSQPATEANLDALDAGGFLARSGLGTSQRVGPRHGLLQEVVYRGLTRRRRTALHARIARRLAELRPDDTDMLARHCWLGGLWEDALRHNELAARRALARFGNREAVVLLDRALDALSQLPATPELRERGIDLRLLLREPLFRLGRSDQLAERLREAEALAIQGAQTERAATLRVMQVHHAWMTGDLHVAETLLLPLELAAGNMGDEALRLRCLFQRGLIAMSRQDHAACAAAMETVAAAADDGFGGRFGVDLPLAVVALSYQARELADLGELRPARAAAAACLAAAERVGKPFSWVFAVLADGYVTHREGRSTQAVARLREALPHCERAESELMRVVVLMLLGAAELGAGDAEAAEIHLEEAVRMADAMRFMALQDVRLAWLEQARAQSRRHSPPS